jgi:hypothetical protein
MIANEKLKATGLWQEERPVAAPLAKGLLDRGQRRFS